MHLQQIEAPEELAVALDVVKQHCRVEIDEDDAYLTSLVETAIRLLEESTRRQFVTATWRLTLDRFPCNVLELPVAPVQSIEQIQYYDADDELQTLDEDLYQFVAGEPARLAPALNQAWPASSTRLGAVVIDFVAGYGDDADAVPVGLKQAVQWLTAMYYDNRVAAEDDAQLHEMPFGVQSQIWLHRWCL